MSILQSLVKNRPEKRKENKMLVRILDLGAGGKQEAKKKSQKKDWNQQETYLTNDISLETNPGHYSEGQALWPLHHPCSLPTCSSNPPPPLLKKKKEKQVENKRWKIKGWKGGGGQVFLQVSIIALQLT